MPLPYQASATVIFDSPATLQAVTSHPARLFADAQTYSRTLGAAPRSFYGLDLEPGVVATTYNIRARHADPRLA